MIQYIRLKAINFELTEKKSDRFNENNITVDFPQS